MKTLGNYPTSLSESPLQKTTILSAVIEDSFADGERDKSNLNKRNFIKITMMHTLFFSLSLPLHLVLGIKLLKPCTEEMPL